MIIRRLKPGMESLEIRFTLRQESTTNYTTQAKDGLEWGTRGLGCPQLLTAANIGHRIICWITNSENGKDPHMLAKAASTCGPQETKIRACLAARPRVCRNAYYVLNNRTPSVV